MAAKRTFSLADLPHPTKTYHTQSYDRIRPSNTGNASGKTVLITGGASGVGYSISRAFAAAGAAKILIVSRSPGPQADAKQKLEQAYPNTKIETHSLATTDEQGITNLFKTAGPIDILVLSAGIAHAQPSKPHETPFSDIWKCYETNVQGNFITSLAYISQPTPVAKTIINVSNIAPQKTFPRMIGYNTSKAAFTKVMQHLDVEYGIGSGGNLRTFSFNPGSHYTPGTSPFMGPDAFAWDDIDLPGDFAVWLSTSEAEFLSGRFLWCHWDVDELIALKERVRKDAGFLRMSVNVH